MAMVGLTGTVLLVAGVRLAIENVWNVDGTETINEFETGSGVFCEGFVRLMMNECTKTVESPTVPQEMMTK